MKKPSFQLICSRLILILAFWIFVASAGCGMAETKKGLLRQVNNSDSTAGSFLVSMQRMAEWEPGLPRVIKQLAIDNLGNLQIAVLQDKSLKSLAEAAGVRQLSEKVEIDDLFKLHDRYVKSSPPGLIEEGYPLFYKFTIFNFEVRKIKIIDCEADSMPEKLKQLEKLLTQFESRATRIEEKGLFLRAHPLGVQGSDEVLKNATVPVIDQQRSKEMQILLEALNRPTVLFKVANSEYDAMREFFAIAEPIRKRNLFVRNQWGVMKIEFYKK